mgnify:CR=1 FL=1
MATKKVTDKRAPPAAPAKTKPAAAKKAAPKALEQDGPKSTLQRVQKLREERARLGLKRLELYVHPDDWDQVKVLAARLQRKREKLEES